MPDIPAELAAAIADRPVGGPSCGGCGEPAVVQWQRRSADDPDATVAVYSCGPHAISLDAGAHIHRAACTAPNPATAPACDCTPEPLPAPDPAPGSTASTTLPTGWVVPAEA